MLHTCTKSAVFTFIRAHRVVLAALILSGVMIAMSTNDCYAATPAKPAASGALPTDAEGFTFLTGNWRVHNRQMKEPLSGRTEWLEYEAKARFYTLLDGLVSVEELRNAKGEPFGSAMRTFDREKRTWSDAWVSARDGVLQLPSHGRFVDGVGIWDSPDEVNGKKTIWRGTWRRVSKNEVIWEQLTSTDDGKTWVLNWHMRFERADENGKALK